VLGQESQQGLGFEWACPLRDELVELGGVRASSGMGRETSIRGEVGACHRVTQAGEDRIRVGGDEHIASVGGGVRTRGRDTGQGTSAATTDHVADLEIRHRRFHDRRDGFVDRDVDLFDLATLLAFPQRGERPDNGEQRGERIAEADATARGGPVGVAGGMADAADRLADTIRSRPRTHAVRSGRTPTRARRSHRVRAGHGVVVEARTPRGGRDGSSRR